MSHHFVKKTASLTVLFAFAAGMAALTLAGAPAYAEKNKDKDKPAASASAPTAAPASAPASGEAGYRIAVVDMGVLMQKYSKREQKYADLQKTVDELQKEIDVKQKGIEAARKEYEAGRDKMTDDQRSTAKLQIENDIASYKSELEKRQRMIDTNEEKVLKEVVEDIQKVIAQVAQQESYHLVLNSGGGPRASVLYSSTRIDITSKVLEILNK